MSLNFVHPATHFRHATFESQRLSQTKESDFPAAQVSAEQQNWPVVSDYRSGVDMLLLNFCRNQVA